MRPWQQGHIQGTSLSRCVQWKPMLTGKPVRCATASHTPCMAKGGNRHLSCQGPDSKQLPSLQTSGRCLRNEPSTSPFTPSNSLSSYLLPLSTAACAHTSEMMDCRDVLGALSQAGGAFFLDAGAQRYNGT